MTMLRDVNTKRGEFVFFADRLATLIVEAALAEIPRQPKDITTANGVPFHGVDSCDAVRPKSENWKRGWLTHRASSACPSSGRAGRSRTASAGLFGMCHWARCSSSPIPGRASRSSSTPSSRSRSTRRRRPRLCRCCLWTHRWALAPRHVSLPSVPCSLLEHARAVAIRWRGCGHVLVTTSSYR